LAALVLVVPLGNDYLYY